MMTSKKSVAIIGAGASGLPSIRHALAYGLDVTCFEASGNYGGLWRYKPEETEESSVMKSTVINSSKEMTAYSDFPPPAEMANFMHNTEMYRYLQLYAQHFDLVRHIRFHHKVLNVERSSSYASDGKWTVTFLDPEGVEHEREFDGVLMCSGHHTIPHWPKPFPGQDSFKGKIIHSHSYKDFRGYADQVVVVVGVGNSGGDIAVELSKIAKQVYLVTRRGTWVLNRIFDYGYPVDLALSTRVANNLNRIVPSWVTNSFLESKVNARFDHGRYGLKPAHRIMAAHVTVNDELPNRIASGTVKIKPNIRRFTENGIEFMDGSVLEQVDDVIYSTGFSFEFGLVENGKLIPVVENEVDLYHNMFPLETSDHNSLAVIGLIQPLGSIMPIAEMQARVFYENLVGNHKLPSKTEMCADINIKKKQMMERYVKSRRHTIQVDYITFMDELAKQIGCYPNFSDLFMLDPILALKVYFGPALPYTYRLFGPHKWAGAKQAIETLDHRVFRGTNSGPYQPDNSTLYKILAVIFVIIALFLIF